MATRPRRPWSHLAEQAGDQIPAWLLWPGVILSVVAVVYAYATDWGGFVINIAATAAVLGMGLLITHRLLRWWRQRPLKPTVEEIPLHLHNVLRRLLEDVDLLGAGPYRTVLGALGDSDDQRQRLTRTARYATSLAAGLEEAAGTRPGVVQVQKVLAFELTLERAVEHMNEDIGRLQGIVPLVESSRAGERLQVAAQKWKALRGMSRARLDVLLAARDVALTAKTLTEHLLAELPDSLLTARPATAGGLRMNPWNLVLLVPFLMLITPWFNSIEPRLFGMPFFYWVQFAFVPVGVAAVAVVYVRTRGEVDPVSAGPPPDVDELDGGTRAER